MPYIKKVKIKGKEYYYLFHTIRGKDKFLKKSKYLGKEIPKDIEAIKEQFIRELTQPKTEDEKVIESLTPLERKIIPHLNTCTTATELAQKTKCKDIEVQRALYWLQNKQLIELKSTEKETITLDKNGEHYKQKGLPEKQFLQQLPTTLDQLRKHFSPEEVNISIGTLKKQGAIEFGKTITITDKGRQLLKSKSPEEIFLHGLPKEKTKLNDKEKKIEQILTKRKQIIKIDTQKTLAFTLTDKGKNITKLKLKTHLLETLTPELLMSGKWRGKTFRRYDVTSPVPKTYPGRKHFVNQAIEYVKQIWLDLGFQEMKGPLIDTSFWVFDALFTAQDHPVREMQDTFFMKEEGKLPEKELIERIKATHEKGWTTGSKGWQYTWSEKEAKKMVLRTHTTSLSARTIASLKTTDMPCKFFSVGKVFRNETLDWSHLSEFYQTEGIVVGEGLTFRHLLGYLQEFYKKMGFTKVRFRPAFFPYTMPSVEPEVFHPVHKKWLELGGAGILRPEVVKPLLGKDVPVLAWGLGVDRVVTDYYQINDLRMLYDNDIKRLRESKIWVK